MARYQLKPNGEIVLILSASEASGLALCAREGYIHLRRIGGGALGLGNKVQETAAQRAVTTLQMATGKAS